MYVSDSIRWQVAWLTSVTDVACRYLQPLLVPLGAQWRVLLRHMEGTEERATSRPDEFTDISLAVLQ